MGNLRKLFTISVLTGLMMINFGCSSANKVVNDTKTGLFKYDQSKALNVKEISVKDMDAGVKVHEITYDAYDTNINIEGTNSAYMVEPKGKGPFPTVIYFHWLGNENSNKDEFLDEAVALAKKGIAGFLIDGYVPWKVKPSGDMKNDKDLITYQMIELRRALDYVTSLSYVDSDKLAYVGHDYGSMYGAILSGADKRIKYYDIVAGMGNFSDWALVYWISPGLVDNKDYKQKMSDYDPITFIKKTYAKKLLFQFANNDEYITKEAADEFYNAASESKEVKHYDIGHEMNIDAAKADRQKWLLDCFGISK